MGVQDFGMGISPERIKICGAYGKSTKRDSNNLLGGFGIGLKSVFCYTKTFYVDTVWEGQHYIYFISPNAEGVPRIDLMFQEDTELTNRAKLWFYLKPDEVRRYGYSVTTEANKFLDGSKRKTIYFNNLVYDFDNSLDDLNKYKRIEGKHFVFSEAKPFEYMHLLLGQVPYEINYSLLGISPIQVPVAIKVEGVMPVPTREDIKYSTIAIEKIKEAIKLASTELVELCNKERIDVTDWKEYLRLRDVSPHVNLGSRQVEIRDAIKYSDTNLKEIVFKPLEGLNYASMSKYNFFPFKCNAIIKSGRKTTCNYSPSYYEYNRNAMSLRTQLQGKKNTFLSNRRDIYIFKKEKYSLEEYKKLLSLRKDDKANWRAKIIKYQKFVDSVWDSMESYDDIVVPKEVVEKGARSVVARNKVTIYQLREKMKRDGDMPSTGEALSLDKLRDKQMVIYGTKDDMPTLDKLWRVLKKTAIFYTVESNFKHLDERYVHVSKFMETRKFSKTITAYKIHTLLKKGGSLCDSGYYKTYRKKLSSISLLFSSLIEELEKYMEQHLKGAAGYGYDVEYMQDCIKLCEEQKLWDYQIYHKIEEFDKILQAFDFVRLLREESEWTDFAIQHVKGCQRESIKYLYNKSI